MKLTKSKRIITSLIIAAMLLLSVFVLSACKDDDEPKTDEPKTIEVATEEQLINAFAGDANIVKLTDDILVQDTLRVTRTFVLDLNGKTIYNETPIWVDTEEVDNWSIISVGKNGNLTVTGNGTIRTLENDCYPLDVVDGGKLVIENGTFVGNISAVYVFEGTAEIKGGEYSIQQLDNNYHDYRFTLNLEDNNREAQTAKIIVTGGSFYNFDPANCLAEGPNTNFVAEGYTSQLKADVENVYEVVKDSQE